MIDNVALNRDEMMHLPGEPEPDPAIGTAHGMVNPEQSRSEARGAGNSERAVFSLILQDVPVRPVREEDEKILVPRGTPSNQHSSPIHR